ncbi:uncharacterized protein [Anabrus simplex]|uniref:uncharacterized protein n=1 Tax=Anabrus simplex TaxID=316456 RepID=UPI0035A2D273
MSYVNLTCNIRICFPCQEFIIRESIFVRVICSVNLKGIVKAVGGGHMDPAIFPEEIWIKILQYCDVADILSFGCTCRYLNKTVDTEYLWKLKWQQLEYSSPFDFPDVRHLQMLNLSFKRMCYRLHMIMNSGESVVFPRCYHCVRFTCRAPCVEDRGSRVVIDIGNKFTWIVTPNFGVRRHFSMFGIPKETAHSKESQVPTKTDTLVRPCKSVSSRQIEADKICRARPNGPFCVFCNPVKLYREKKRVAQGAWERSTMDQRMASSDYAKLCNGFCCDTVDVLGIPNMNVVSPAAALLTDTMFHVVREFIGHLFHQMGLSPVLQKPNAILMFCEPLSMSHSLRIQLLHYLFLQVKVSRICLVSKPLATCAMLGLETCVVVDSGALNTSVSVIINGRVEPGRWRQVPIGGWHVAENLKQAMQWQPEEYAEIPVSYLDTLAVKEKCRLSYNFANEERRRGPARREHINLRVDSYADYKQFWRVSLGEELYLAPELMYASLDLPHLIKDVVLGLPEPIQRDCLSHILITGGNTDLAGFKSRMCRDLCDLLPEFRNILNVKSCPGSTSWSVAMGSTYVSLPRTVHSDVIMQEYDPGTPFWLSREQYILHGCESLTCCEDSFR